MTDGRNLVGGTRPTVVAIGGPSGSGKSVLADAVARAMGATLLRSDVVRKALHRVAPEASLPPEAYGPAASADVLAYLRSCVLVELADGKSVVLDSTALDPIHRAAFAAAAKEGGAAFLGFWLDAPEDVLARRIAARRDDASDATVEVMRRQLPRAAIPEGWARIDASRAPEEVRKDVLSALVAFHVPRWVAAMDSAIGSAMDDGADRGRLHAGDEALLRAAATGKGAVQVTPELAGRISEAIEAHVEEIETRHPELVVACDPETRLAVAAWTVRHLVDHARDGGSFRHLIYDRMGFGPDAYTPLYLAGGMTASNEFVIVEADPPAAAEAAGALLDALAPRKGPVTFVGGEEPWLTVCRAAETIGKLSAALAAEQEKRRRVEAELDEHVALHSACLRRGAELAVADRRHDGDGKEDRP